MFTTLKEAEAVAGPLGKPSKMPGYSYGLPASRCITGSQLAKIPNTVCSKCYALKGRYVFPNVQACLERRFASLTHPQWVEALVFMIKRRKCEYFRWHDSGDIQGHWHLDNLCEIARQCPETRFWLPTREKKMVSSYTGVVPPNLVIRVSGTMINEEAPVRFLHSSSVSTDKAQATCPAHKQGNECGDCRACWDPKVRSITYPFH